MRALIGGIVVGVVILVAIIAVLVLVLVCLRHLYRQRKGGRTSVGSGCGRYISLSLL